MGLFLLLIAVVLVAFCWWLVGAIGWIAFLVLATFAAGMIILPYLFTRLEPERNLRISLAILTYTITAAFFYLLHFGKVLPLQTIDDLQWFGSPNIGTYAKFLLLTVVLDIVIAVIWLYLIRVAATKDYRNASQYALIFAIALAITGALTLVSIGRWTRPRYEGAEACRVEKQEQLWWVGLKSVTVSNDILTFDLVDKTPGDIHTLDLYSDRLYSDDLDLLSYKTGERIAAIGGGYRTPCSTEFCQIKAVIPNGANLRTMGFRLVISTLDPVYGRIEIEKWPNDEEFREKTAIDYDWSSGTCIRGYQEVGRLQ